MNTKSPKTTKLQPDVVVILDSIDDRFDRAIATANLLSIANNHAGEELADDTVPTAAFALYEDLRALKAEVAKITDTL